jgi:hypothetical protein
MASAEFAGQLDILGLFLVTMAFLPEERERRSGQGQVHRRSRQPQAVPSYSSGTFNISLANKSSLLHVRKWFGEITVEWNYPDGLRGEPTPYALRFRTTDFGV